MLLTLLQELVLVTEFFLKLADAVCLLPDFLFHAAHLARDPSFELVKVVVFNFELVILSLKPFNPLLLFPECVSLGVHELAQMRFVCLVVCEFRAHLCEFLVQTVILLENLGLVAGDLLKGELRGFRLVEVFQQFCGLDQGVRCAALKS